MNETLSAQNAGRADEFQKLMMHAFSLPAVLRKVFLLCEVRGFSIAEAARILGKSITVATSRLEQARREMGERMGIE